MLQQDQNMHLGSKDDESVEELLQKLAKKGKKVKLLDESTSVKELPPRQEESQDEAEEDINERQDIDVPDDLTPSKSSVVKKIEKIKEDRDDEEAKRLLEQQQQQQILIDQTNQKLKEEALKREEMERILKEMEERLVIGGNALEEKEREQALAHRNL